MNPADTNNRNNADESPAISTPCPLCTCETTRPHSRDPHRCYCHCPVCDLIFVPREFHLTTSAERAVYDLHENSVDDPRYRQFLNRLAAPVLERLRPHSHGLDFGCGPGPALAAMLHEAGHHVVLYDRYFATNPTVFMGSFDFIVSSEVFEHLRQPGPEFDRLWTCLRPGGLLGIMTRRLNDREKFAGWFYTRDPTHIAFYSDLTFRWLADRSKADLTIIDDDVVLLKKLAD